MPPNASAQPFVFPPLPNEVLPSSPELLPKIDDPEIARQITTHSSFHGNARRATILETKGEETKQDYEKLEHVGDGLLGPYFFLSSVPRERACADSISFVGAIVTCLLDDLFPNLKPGPSTVSVLTQLLEEIHIDGEQVLKHQLVSNELLAQLADFYALPYHLKASPSALYTVRNQPRTKAALFEAYIAGVFYDRLGSDAGNVSRGEALNVLENWLRPLYTPIAHWALGSVREQQMILSSLRLNDQSEDDDLARDHLASGASARLNEHFIGRLRAEKPEYISREIGLGIWNVTCVAVERSGKIW